MNDRAAIRQEALATGSSRDFGAPAVHLQCLPDPGFAEWLAASGGSLAITTYQAGRVLLAGWNGRQVTFLPRQFDRPMGLDVNGGSLALATRHALTLFSNAPSLARHYREPGAYDALFLPRVTYHMPQLNLHDVAFGDSGLWLVNTRLSCLAKASAVYTFEPHWRPRFITDLVPEDRCHLNGLALRDGRPAFITALGETNQAGGWRAGKATGGIVIDVASGEILLRGLAMPHSPRWHAGRLWLLNSGAGELLAVDPPTARADVVCALPGYARGLTFVGHHALVGLSQIREKSVFGGLPVEARHATLLCAVAVVDVRTGRTEGFLRFVAGCSEIYDLRFLAGMRRPNLLNLEKEEVRQAIFAPDCHYWLRPESDAGPG